MTAVLLDRKRATVVHLGLFAYDQGENRLRTGRYVPICGQDFGNKWRPFGGAYGGPYPEGKAICTKCRRSVAALESAAIWWELR